MIFYHLDFIEKYTCYCKNGQNGKKCNKTHYQSINQLYIINETLTNSIAHSLYKDYNLNYQIRLIGDSVVSAVTFENCPVSPP